MGEKFTSHFNELRKALVDGVRERAVFKFTFHSSWVGRVAERVLDRTRTMSSVGCAIRLGEGVVQ